jgi:hypothetical protein
VRRFTLKSLPVRRINGCAHRNRVSRSFRTETNRQSGIAASVMITSRNPGKVLRPLLPVACSSQFQQRSEEQV